jgi:catalase
MASSQQGGFTRFSGCPVAQNAISLTAGPTGPVLLQDVELLEKLMHFDREKVPPRNVHALGAGCYGTFSASNDISQYSKAAVFKVRMMYIWCQKMSYLN